MGAEVLIVDDDAAVGKVLATLLEQKGFTASYVASAQEALSAIEERPFDVVISDLRMPGMDGLALLGEINRRWPEIPVILLTAHGSVPLAVEAMKAGAAEFMLKPFERDEIAFVIEKTLAKRPSPPTLEGSSMIGASDAMKEVFGAIQKVATSQATVLIRGETGTGKELVARALHDESARKEHPFVRVHSAALPDTLLESELFGYEKGAFTGAATRKPGRVELAHRGTLFLDEIGDITPHVQVKLLRLLQEREFERVGGTQTLKVDVRFVAATHRDLEAMVKDGTFREDLFYRLNVVPVRVPPLRERPGDVALLASHFARVFGGAKTTIEPRAMECLCAHGWPGNVRQLQNLIERLVVLADGPTVTHAAVVRELGSPAAVGLARTRTDAEKQAIVDALAAAKNNRTLAARILGVSRRTLYNKLKEHGIER